MPQEGCSATTRGNMIPFLSQFTTMRKWKVTTPYSLILLSLVVLLRAKMNEDPQSTTNLANTRKRIPLRPVENPRAQAQVFHSKHEFLIVSIIRSTSSYVQSTKTTDLRRTVLHEIFIKTHRVRVHDASTHVHTAAFAQRLESISNSVTSQRRHSVSHGVMQ